LPRYYKNSKERFENDKYTGFNVSIEAIPLISSQFNYSLAVLAYCNTVPPGAKTIPICPPFTVDNSSLERISKVEIDFITEYLNG